MSGLAMLRRLMLVAVLVGFGVSARAAQLAGVSLPDTQMVGGTPLVLNGIGLRTYSFLAVHVYVAGLYLQQPSHDADAILASSEIKMVQMHFVHDVGVAAMRKTWRKGLTKNCIAPCVLSQASLAQFLAALQPVRAGEDVTLVFNPSGADAYYDDKFAGHVDDVGFSRVMLAVFIGHDPAAPGLKRALLGG